MLLESVKMKTRYLAVFVLLVSCVVIAECVDGSTECTTGAACFRSGVLPEGVTNTSRGYYCCLQKNMTLRSDGLADRPFNCSCVPDDTLDAQIQQWADGSMDKGRMCLRDDECQGAAVITSVNERFEFCCFGHAANRSVEVAAETDTYDGDKQEYNGCRCRHLPRPTPDPTAYVVPPVLGGLNSSGEACFYDEGCQDQPALKCHTRGVTNVTFCCYGSRGLVTKNEGDQLTRCTCTNEAFGTQCETNPVALADTTQPCQTACDNRTDDDKCTDDNDNVRCCLNNMVVVANQTGGSFATCACKAQARKKCGNESSPPPSSSAMRLDGHVSDVIVAICTAAFVRLAQSAHY